MKRIFLFLCALCAYSMIAGSSLIEQVVCGQPTLAGSPLSRRSSFETNSFTMTHTSGARRFCGVIITPANVRYYTDYVTVTATTSQAPTTPSNPNPIDKATDIGLNPTFSWSSTGQGGEQVYYRLMLSTIENTLPVEKQGTGTSTSSPYTLKPGVKYYWKIESSNSQGKISFSPTWSFTTAGQPINPVLSLSTTSVVLGNSLTISGNSWLYF